MVAYLSGPDGRPPVVGVFASSLSRGKGLAVLRLADVWELARRLDELLKQAGYQPSGGGDRDQG